MEINLKKIAFFKKRFYFCKTILKAKSQTNNKPPRRAARQHTWGAFLILGLSPLCRCRDFCQKIIQDIQVALEIKPGLLIVKPPASLATIEHIKASFRETFIVSEIFTTIHPMRCHRIMLRTILCCSGVRWFRFFTVS